MHLPTAILGKASRVFWFFVAFYAIIGAALIVAGGLAVYRSAWPGVDLGWQYACGPDHCFVTTVDLNGPAAGKLQNGDRIIAVNGQKDFLAINVVGQKRIMIPTRDSYAIRVLRASSEIQYELRTATKTDFLYFASIVLPLLTAAISFITAVIVGLSKPDRKIVRLFSCTWMTAGLLQLVPAMKMMDPYFQWGHLRLWQLIWLVTFSPMVVAFAYHFYHRFPSDLQTTRLWSFFQTFFYVCSGLLAAFFTFIRFNFVLDPRNGNRFFLDHFQRISQVERTLELIDGLAIIAICGVVAYNYRRVKELDHRRRIRWVVYGSVAGALPLSFFFLTNVWSGLRLPMAPPQAFLDRYFLFANLALVTIPITVAFTILKHRMFDIHLVVRRGVQYLFAKGFLQVFIYLPVVLIVYAIRTHRDQSIPEVLSGNSWYLLLLGAAITGLVFRKHLRNFLDRKFFREVYNSEKILMMLVDQIRNFQSMPEVATWVSLQLESALHPKKILIFYRERTHGKFSLGYSSSEHRPHLELPESAEFLRLAEHNEKSVDLISSSDVKLPQLEKDWLDQQAIHLLVPMSGPDLRLHGVLLLGEKRSEEPYSEADRNLLEAVAGQMGILYENLLLKERVHQDQRIQREVIAHLTGQNKNLVKECPACGTCYDSSSEICGNDNVRLELTLPVERTIDGKYRLDKLIGRGGMGAVYQAKDLRLNRDVAIKIMVGSMFGDARAVKRFEREARASAQLNHPNVITIYDFGGIGDGAYLVMELLQGDTLRQAIARNGNILPEHAAEWFNQILEGIKAAHRSGIIHRDLKPENVLITIGENNRPLIKILDFGLAKMVLEDIQSKSLTAPGSIVGTLHYMSPEQLGAGEVDERTDIFSIGVMVAEALTGRLPFTGKSHMEVVVAIIQRPFQLEGDAPEIRRLNEVLQKSMEKTRDNRYSSVAQMQNELINAIRNCPPFPRPAGEAAICPPTDAITQ